MTTDAATDGTTDNATDGMGANRAPGPAIVTGGAQGIGLAAARALAARSHPIALWDMDEAALGTARDALGEPGGRPVHVERLDITDHAAVERATAATADALGEPEALVNSAGIAGPNAPVVDYPVDAWRQIVEINLTGSFLVARAVAARMRAAGYGRIVLIASVAGKEGNPNASAYSASKAGVIALAKSLGKEMADIDVAVNCVTPAAARTRIFDQMSEEHIGYMLSKIPRGRFLEVDEAAAMIAWLCSAENSFTTAGVFDLSGGRATY